MLYSPRANYNGTDQFTFEVCSGSLCKQATVSLTVDAVNDAPEPKDDFVKVTGTEIGKFVVLTNDVDIDGDELVIARLTYNADQLAASFDGRAITYQAKLGMVGDVDIVYTVTDGKSTASAILHVNVSVVVSNEATVKAYPNPFDGKMLHLKFSGSYSQNTDFYLVNDLGIEMHLGAFNLRRLVNGELTVDLSHKELSSASYVLRIIGEKNSFKPLRVIVVE